MLSIYLAILPVVLTSLFRLLNNLQITGIAADTFRAMTNLLELYVPQQEFTYPHRTPDVISQGPV